MATEYMDEQLAFEKFKQQHIYLSRSTTVQYIMNKQVSNSTSPTKGSG